MDEMNTHAGNAWRQQLSDLLACELERQTEAIFKDAEYFLNHPELASAEVNTSNYIFEVMTEAGLSPQRVAQTGVYADIGNRMTQIGIIADMDGIEVGGRIQHACGHHAQLTHLLGVLRVLSAVQLSGFNYGVRLIAAPAEELGRSVRRDALLMNKQLTSLSGKMCLYQAGVFQPLQALISCHLADDLPDRTLLAGYETAGCVTVTLRLPVAGISKDVQKVIRILQNCVTIWNQHVEEYTRGTSRRQHQDVVHVRFDMSGLPDGIMVVFLYGTTESGFEEFVSVTSGIVEEAQELFTGHGVEILDVCNAYAPLMQDQVVSELVCQHAEAVGFTVKHLDCRLDGFTDLGFLSRQIAVCHPLIGGTQGVTHTEEFRVIDPKTAYILPVRILLEVIVDYYLKIAK